MAEKMLTQKKYFEAAMIVVLLTAASFLLFNNLSGETMVHYDEPYYSYVDYQIVKNPQNIIFPEEDSPLAKLYFQKPPLKTWLKYPILKIFGFSIWSLRLLDVLFALGSIILTFLIGKNLFSARAGFIAGMALLTMRGFQEYWARSNLYDSGFIFFSLLFIYSFTVFWEKPVGPVFSGIALAGAFYFKHVQSFLLLGLAGLFFILAGNWKKIFSRKFILMCAMFFIPVAAWFIPFQITCPSFIKAFVKAEITYRVFKGHFAATKGDYLFYFRSLNLLSGWVLLLLPALALTLVDYFRNKRRKILFLILWAIVPFILLSLAESKLERYLYISYPAFALVIGYAFMRIVQSFKEKKGKAALQQIIPAVFFISLFIVTQYVFAFTITENPEQKVFHIYNNYHQMNHDTNMILSGLKPRDFKRAELIHLESVKNKRWSDQDPLSTIRTLRKNDSIVLTRTNYLNLLTAGELSKENLGFELSYLDYTESYYFLSTVPRVKIILFRADSKLAEHLHRRGVEFFKVRHPFSYLKDSSADDSEYIERTFKYILGFPPNPLVKERILQELAEGRKTRERLNRTLLCYAERGDLNYILFEYEIGIKRGMADLHVYTAIPGHRELFEDIYVIGLKDRNFKLPEQCELNTVFETWKFIKAGETEETAYLNLIKKHLSQKPLIVRRDLIIRALMKDNDFSTFRDYMFCNYYAPYVEKTRNYKWHKGIICRKGSEAHKILRAAGAKFYPFENIVELLPMETSDNREFILDAYMLLFNMIPTDERLSFWAGKLERGEISRAELLLSF